MISDKKNEYKMMDARFNAVADYYDKSAYLAQATSQGLMQRLALMQLNPQRILDIGCGTGFCLQQLQSQYPQVMTVGLDLAIKMLQHARKNHALLIAADAELAPLADQSFDLITANLSLAWGNFKQLLCECARLLKANGLFLFTTFGVDTLKEVRQDYDRQRLLDMHDLGDTLLQQGFSDPVMEVERLSFRYERLSLFKQEYQSLGLAPLITLQPKIVDNPAVTFEIIYGHAWRALPQQPHGEISIPLSAIRKRHEHDL